MTISWLTFVHCYTKQLYKYVNFIMLSVLKHTLYPSIIIINYLFIVL